MNNTPKEKELSLQGLQGVQFVKEEKRKDSSPEKVNQ
jgi:hypothetical protein